jgi:hypothetical protein
VKTPRSDWGRRAVPQLGLKAVADAVVVEVEATADCAPTTSAPTVPGSGEIVTALGAFVNDNMFVPLASETITDNLPGLSRSPGTRRRSLLVVHPQGRGLRGGGRVRDLRDGEPGGLSGDTVKLPR